jgi:hypothetical protein
MPEEQPPLAYIEDHDVNVDAEIGKEGGRALLRGGVWVMNER